MANTNRLKTQCPITRNQFDDKAVSQTVQIAGQPVLAQVHKFSTGSFGFYANAKVTIVIDGVPCQCQVGLNITLVGSKDAPPATIMPVKEYAAELAILGGAVKVA